jgi:hypothetical protein
MVPFKYEQDTPLRYDNELLSSGAILTQGKSYKIESTFWTKLGLLGKCQSADNNWPENVKAPTTTGTSSMKNRPS